MVCFDSDVLINLLRNDEKTVLRIKEIEESDKITTTAINGFELWKGVYRKGKDERAVSELLEIVSLLEFNGKASKKAAEIFEHLRSRGKIVDALDVMIAAIAIINNEPLLTFNKKHFENIPGLMVI